MVKKKPNTILFLSIGIVVALIIGLIIGSQVFSKTEIEYISEDGGKFCFNEDYKSLYENIDNSELEQCANLFNSDYPIINQLNTIEGWAETIENVCSNDNQIGCLTYGEENSEKIIGGVESIISSIRSSCQ